jgi:hypothetical protein
MIAMPNGGDGIRIVNAQNNLIGTSPPADRNIGAVEPDQDRRVVPVGQRVDAGPRLRVAVDFQWLDDRRQGRA